MKTSKLALVATLAIAGASFASGYIVGIEECDHPDWIEEAEAEQESELSPTEDLMFKRNIIWSVMNKDIHRVPNSPEKRLGGAIALILFPAAPPEAIDKGFNILTGKAFLYFSEQEQQTIRQVFVSGTPSQRAAVLRLIIGLDHQANELISSALDDTGRINLFLQGQRIPLEGDAENEYWEDGPMSLPEESETCPANPEPVEMTDEPEEERFYHDEIQEEDCDAHDEDGNCIVGC